MSTILQQNLAKEIVKNVTAKKKKNKKELVVSSGYDLTTAIKQIPAVFNQKGVQEELRKYGLTEELISTALVEDIESKKGKRVAELRLGAEILNMNERESEPNRPVNIIIPIQVSQSFNIDSNSNGTDTETIRSNPKQEQI